MNALTASMLKRQPEEPASGRQDRLRSPLEMTLLGWACDHWGDCVDAIEACWGDWEYERRCLGAIFRRATAADPSWFYRACTEQPREVLALSPAIREIPWESLGGLASWGSIPGRLGWAEYVRCLRVIDGLGLYPSHRDAPCPVAPTPPPPARAVAADPGLFPRLSA